MTKIKRMEEHGLLQLTIRMIQPPPFSSVPLQMVICKEDGSQDDLNHGNGGARILANDHPDDRASSVLLRSSVSAIFQNCNEMIPVGKALNTFNSHYMNKINNANKLGPKWMSENTMYQFNIFFMPPVISLTVQNIFDWFGANTLKLLQKYSNNCHPCLVNPISLQMCRQRDGVFVFVCRL